MSGPRNPVSFTVAELATTLGGVAEGDTDRVLTGVRGLEEAGSEHLSFLANPKYARRLADSRAGAVLVRPPTRAKGRTVIRLDDPYVAFARALALFHPEPPPEPGIDERSYVHPQARVHPSATLDAFAWVGPGAEIGARSWLQPGVYVGRDARVGEDCRLFAGSVVAAGCTLGNRVWLNPGAVIGAEGFGFAPHRDGHVKIPQTGVAIVEDDVEIGAHGCVDRAAMGETRVRRHSKLDNLTQIGHGSDIGEGALLAAYTGIAGSTRIGPGAMFGGKSGAINHLEIGRGVHVSTQSVVMSNQPDGARLSGTPAFDHRTWLRASAALTQLPRLLRRVRDLERRLAQLEGERDPSGEEE